MQLSGRILARAVITGPPQGCPRHGIAAAFPSRAYVCPLYATRAPSIHLVLWSLLIDQKRQARRDITRCGSARPAHSHRSFIVSMIHPPRVSLPKPSPSWTDNAGPISTPSPRPAEDHLAITASSLTLGWPPVGYEIQNPARPISALSRPIQFESHLRAPRPCPFLYQTPCALSCMVWRVSVAVIVPKRYPPQILLVPPGIHTLLCHVVVSNLSLQSPERRSCE